MKIIKSLVFYECVVIGLKIMCFHYIYDLLSINNMFISYEKLFLIFCISCVIEIHLVINAKKNNIYKNKVIGLFVAIIIILLSLNMLRYVNLPFNFAYYNNIDNTVTVYKSLYCGEIMQIPEYIHGKKVSMVSGKLKYFHNSNEINTIIIPETVTSIVDNSKCFNNTKRIIFEGKIDEINPYMFSSEVEHIIFEQNVGVISSFAFFSDNSKLKIIEFHGNIDILNENAFFGCDNVEVIYS